MLNMTQLREHSKKIYILLLLFFVASLVLGGLMSGVDLIGLWSRQPEQTNTGKINKVLNELTSQKYSLKGEFVIVIGGKLELEIPDFISKDQEMILKILLKNREK